MDKNEFPPNSNNVLKGAPETPPEKKQLGAVVTSKAVQRKKPLGLRIKEMFFGGDGKGVVRYIASDVLLPALKNLIVEASEQGIKRAVYGDSSPRRRMEPTRSRVSYQSPVYRQDPRTRAMLPDQPPYSPTVARDAGQVIIATRQEAERVLDCMVEVVDQYGAASLADLYSLCDLPSSPIDNKWGWDNLQFAEVKQVRDGWLINLTRPEPL